MVVSTVDPAGQPTSRTVLLKDISPAGFTFFTNLTSTKSKQISINPQVSLLFPWYELHRQVLVTGAAELIPALRWRSTSGLGRATPKSVRGPVTNPVNYKVARN